MVHKHNIHLQEVMDKQVYFHVEEVVQVEITILLHLQLNRVHMEEVVHYFAVAAEEQEHMQIHYIHPVHILILK